MREMKLANRFPGTEWLLVIGVVFVTVVFAVGAIRWFAPQLLGFRPDMQVVRVSKEVAPFYENVFRKEVFSTPDFVINDPLTGVRARQLYTGLHTFGPHDLLGFRNLNIPVVTDIVTIGDSQTYGNNVSLKYNWPSRLADELSESKASVYNMATGGWGAVQYLNMAQYATAFQPRAVVVAFYSGNDSIESFQSAYSIEQWAPLRLDPNLDVSEISNRSEMNLPGSESWIAHLRDRTLMHFTPQLRFVSNDRTHAAVKIGYGIMLEAARSTAIIARTANARAVFTIIPTKELVYVERLRRDAVEPDPDYIRLVEDEQANIDELAEGIRKIPDAVYIDVIRPLQQAAASGTSKLYPTDINGHPLENGYRIIAQTLAPVVKNLLPKIPRGLYGVRTGKKGYRLYLVRDGGYWGFDDELLVPNGWVKPEAAPQLPLRELSRLEFRGMADRVDPNRFGPLSLR